MSFVTCEYKLRDKSRDTAAGNGKLSWSMGLIKNITHFSTADSEWVNVQKAVSIKPNHHTKQIAQSYSINDVQSLHHTGQADSQQNSV